MLGTKEVAEEVGRFLALAKSRGGGEGGEEEPPFVVLDPVMISTSGHSLIDDEARNAMIKEVFPHADMLTPNKFEAEALLGRELRSPEDVEAGARELLDMGVKAVLIKGGHSLAESKVDAEVELSSDANATVGYAQDYFLSSDAPLKEGEERLCDGCRGVWLRTDRFDSKNTHGTGCTLSSAIASALAIGHQQRALVSSESGTGAARAIEAIDACCLAKAYVTQGLGRGLQLGQGPGPVAHTSFPSSHQHFPLIAPNPNLRSSEIPAFLPMRAATAATSEKPMSPSSQGQRPFLGKILPIVDTVEWVERLVKIVGVTDIQLRIKGETDQHKILEAVKRAQTACKVAGVRLWINDHWEAAIQAKCFGVHVGQEDLAKCFDAGGLEAIKGSGLALGISTHSYAELSAALGIKPSYISLGPVFGTSSKDVAFTQQGLATVAKWRQLIYPDVPLVAIGGIGNAETAKLVRDAGADCVAVIGAITNANDIGIMVENLTTAMQ